MKLFIKNKIEIALYEAIGSNKNESIIINNPANGNYNLIFHENEILIVNDKFTLNKIEQWNPLGHLNGCVEHFGRIIIYDSYLSSLIKSKTQLDENWITDDCFNEIISDTINGLIFFHYPESNECFSAVYVDIELDFRPKIFLSDFGIRIA
jgi:hypothetical protein